MQVSFATLGTCLLSLVAHSEALGVPMSNSTLVSRGWDPFVKWDWCQRSKTVQHETRELLSTKLIVSSVTAIRIAMGRTVTSL
jgi:hypothetical protein